MKASLISTVLNEEKTIEKFIDSVAFQSLLPSELIITDGGSRDKTTYIIRKKAKQYAKKLKIILIVKNGNRSVGRNEAIKHASSKYIAVTDVGCIPEKKWFENITKPFSDTKKRIDVVSGYYKPIYRNIFEKCLSAYTSVMPDKLNERDYLPSSRSIAFTKEVWEKSGGYPEHLDTCEDLVFAKKLKDAGLNFVLAGNAIVKWPQRKNIKEAFKQFFSYAKGDGFARHFRPNTPYLFLRYTFAFYLIVLSLIIKSVFLNFFIILAFFGYILWSINKNYKYVNNYKAYFYLPLLQFISDVAVLLGTSLGFLQQISIWSIFRLILKNKLISLIIFIYSFLMIYLIQWGIPNLNHPFNYAMDEWHFSQALRTFVKYGTGSISGAASIPLYHIISSIIFILPFYLLHIINPFAIKNTLDNLPMQHVLFIILRLHTLLYGVLSIAILYSLLKKYIKVFPIIFSAIFIFTPIYISLTNYYKYDVTLIFWIITTLFLLIKYYANQKLNHFMFAGIALGFALSTKFTAAPLLLSYILAYVILSKNINYKHLLIGICISMFTFAFVGIPDLIFGKGNYYQLLYSTLIQGPQVSLGFNLGYPSWFFLMFKEFPSIFGYFLTTIFYMSIIFWTFKLIKNTFKYKLEFFLYLSSLLFLFSTLAFNVDGGGNRALVLLPFMVLLSGLSIKYFYNNQALRIKKVFIIIMFLGLFLQIVQTLTWISVKFYEDPRQTSSRWILNNIPKDNTIGIENIPIYQMLPDFILKDYYQKQHDPSFITRFNYEIIGVLEKKPKYVIITNDFDNLKYVNKSPKKDLVNKLKNENYKIIKVFYPNLKYYNLFSDKIFFIVANIMPVPVTISIYEKL